MSEALDRVIQALAGVSEDEVAAALAVAGVPHPRLSLPVPICRTPLPSPGTDSRIVSEVEWV